MSDLKAEDAATEETATIEQTDATENAEVSDAELDAVSGGKVNFG